MGLLDKLPHWETVFCGRTIRTGALFIAWLYAISLGITWFIYMSLFPANFAFYSDAILASNKGNNDYYSSAYYAYEKRINITLIGMAFTCMFFVQCLHLWGVLKKKRYFMLPSILIGFILLLVNVMGSFLIFIGAAIRIYGFDNLWIFLLPLNIFFCIIIYTMMINISYYRKIRDEYMIKKNSKNTEQSSTAQELV